jgi:hypothetical protein
MKPAIIKSFTPFIIIFILINLLIVLFKNKLLAADYDIQFIWVANLIIFLLTLLGYFLQLKGAVSANFNHFLRGIYSSLLMKMFIIIGALVIYIAVAKGKINTPAILISMGLYLVYTAIEVIQLMKIVRNKPHA